MAILLLYYYYILPDYSFKAHENSLLESAKSWQIYSSNGLRTPTLPAFIDNMSVYHCGFYMLMSKHILYSVIFSNKLKIQRTLHFFYSSALHTVGINHSSSDITVTEQCLNCPYIVISLQEMRGKRVAEGMRGDAFREFRPANSFIKRFLNMLFMQMQLHGWLKTQGLTFNFAY